MKYFENLYTYAIKDHAYNKHQKHIYFMKMGELDHLKNPEPEIMNFILVYGYIFFIIL